MSENLHEHELVICLNDYSHYHHIYPLMQLSFLIHLHDSPLTLIVYGLKGCLDITM